MEEGTEEDEGEGGGEAREAIQLCGYTVHNFNIPIS